MKPIFFFFNVLCVQTYGSNEHNLLAKNQVWRWSKAASNASVASGSWSGFFRHRVCFVNRNVRYSVDIDRLACLNAVEEETESDQNYHSSSPLRKAESFQQHVEESPQVKWCIHVQTFHLVTLDYIQLRVDHSFTEGWGIFFIQHVRTKLGEVRMVGECETPSLHSTHCSNYILNRNKSSC